VIGNHGDHFTPVASSSVVDLLQIAMNFQSPAVTATYGERPLVSGSDKG
jgi:hypothetical protein